MACEWAVRSWEQAVHEGIMCYQCGGRGGGPEAGAGGAVPLGSQIKGRRWVQVIKTFPVTLSRHQGWELELRTAHILAKTGTLPSWVTWDASIPLPLKKIAAAFSAVLAAVA